MTRRNAYFFFFFGRILSIYINDSVFRSRSDRRASSKSLVSKDLNTGWKMGMYSVEYEFSLIEAVVMFPHRESVTRDELMWWNKLKFKENVNTYKIIYFHN